MQEFAPKGVGETRLRTVALSKDLRDAGVTISSQSVTAVVYSGVDGTPSGLIDGVPAVNTEAVTINGALIGIGQAIVVSITGGLDRVSYVLKFSGTLSTGEIWEEDVIQRVSGYVPP